MVTTLTPHPPLASIEKHRAGYDIKYPLIDHFLPFCLYEHHVLEGDHIFP